MADKTPFVALTVPKANGRGTLDLQVKEVVRNVKTGQGNTRRCRYIVCYNEAEARNDAAAREAATRQPARSALKSRSGSPRRLAHRAHLSPWTHTRRTPTFSPRATALSGGGSGPGRIRSSSLALMPMEVAVLPLGQHVEFLVAVGGVGVAQEPKILEHVQGAVDG